MKFEDVKPGMRVRVTSRFTSHFDGWPNQWIKEMDSCIRGVFTVERVSCRGVTLVEDAGRWCFPWQVLEPEPESPDNIEIWSLVLRHAGHLIDTKWRDLIDQYVGGATLEADHVDLGWRRLSEPKFDADFETYRIRPATIMCGGAQIPAPETKAPKKHEVRYTPNINSRGYHMQYLYNKFTWEGTDEDHMILERGLMYLNKEDAVKRARIMLGMEDQD